MTVVFDLVGIQNRDHGERGIARFTLQLALALERQAPGLVDRYEVRHHLPVPGGLEPLISTGRVHLTTSDRRAVEWAAGGVFVAGSLFELHELADSILPRPVRDPRWTTMAVLYDLIPLRFPELYLVDQMMSGPYLARVEAARSIDHSLCISQATADDAAEFLGHGPDRTTVIGAGADARFRPHPDGRDAAIADIAARPPAPGVRPGYLFCQSGIDHRKNISGLMAGYAGLGAEVRAAHPLVLQCKHTPEQAAELRAAAAEHGIADDFVLVGFVGDEELVRLYQGADLAVATTKFEGFGLPVLEAIRCGTPAICSDSSSLKEVQTDPTARFDPDDPASITETMLRFLTDEDERERIRTAEPPPWTWDEAARRTADQIRRAHKLSLDLPPRRPRVALVTPLPPQRSGIATYAGRMIEHLRHRVDLTVFVDGGLEEVAPIEGVRIHETHQFDSVDGTGEPFDRIVTFLGNSDFHIDALQLVRRHGGAVVLHDARLTGLYGEVRHRRPERLYGHSVGATLSLRYPNRYREALEEAWVLDPDEAVRSGVHLLAEVADAAHQLLVHSEHAASVCELDTGRRPDVAFGLPCVDPVGVDDASPPALEPGNHRIVSAGIVSPTKAPEVLFDAMLRVREAVPDATLNFVGGIPDRLRAHYEQMVDAAGLAGAVTFTGHLDDAEFEAWLRGAAVAVQLRAHTNGESSAAVMDCLSAGCPTVVSALGSLSELPDDVVASVPPGADAETVAAVLIDLLGDVAQRAALRDAAHRHAAVHGYGVAAHQLLEALGY